MATYRAPGVYIEEVPGARSISGVSTDVASFVGITERGKENTPTLVTSWNEYQDHFGGFMWNRYVPMAVYNFFAEGGAQCYVVSTGMGTEFTAGKVTVPEDNYNNTSASGTLKFTPKSKGEWANTIRVGITTEPKGDANTENPVSFSVQVLQYAMEPGDHTDLSLSQIMTSRYVISNKLGPAGSSLYADSFYENAVSANGAVLEEFNGFTFEDLLGDELNPSNLMNRINGTSLFLKASTTDFGSLNDAGSIATEAMKLPTRDIYSMKGTGNSSKLAWKKGLDTLDPILDFSTIALPDCVDQTTYSATTSSGEKFEAYWNWSKIQVTDAVNAKASTRELLGKCDLWQRVFAVTDPPYGLSYTEMTGYKTGTGTNMGQPLNSTYGAIYYPWLEATNPITSRLVWLPPSGQTLGRYAATDQAIGPWKAPAGVEDGKLRTARGITYELTQTQRGILNSDGVDAIVPVLSYGICVYGARTVSLNPEWRYVPVRRLAIYIEQSLYFALQWVVFEPNTPALWGRVTRDVTAFMTNLWRQGALFGSSAPEAFFVTCDASNNPPATRDEGYLYIDVGFAPVKPAEFVVIRLSQITLSA